MIAKRNTDEDGNVETGKTTSPSVTTKTLEVTTMQKMIFKSDTREVCGICGWNTPQDYMVTLITEERVCFACAEREAERLMEEDNDTM